MVTVVGSMEAFELFKLFANKTIVSKEPKYPEPTILLRSRQSCLAISFTDGSTFLGLCIFSK